MKRYLIYLIKGCKVLKREGLFSLLRKLKRKIQKKGKPAPLSKKSTYIFAKEFELISVTPHNNPEIPTLRTKNDFDYSLALPLLFSPVITNRKIAVFFHVYYTDMVEKYISFLNNIPCAYDLFISTDSTEKVSEINSNLAGCYQGSASIRVFPNRGRNVAPLFVGFKHECRNYDSLLHIHTKKSPHDQKTGGWDDYLLNNLLGSKDIVASILYILETGQASIVYPQHYPVLRNCINWGFNYSACYTLLKKMGIDITSDLLLEFPSGCMFWADPKSLDALFNADLTFDDFPDEPIFHDGSLAHVIERALLYIVENNGYKWLKVQNNDSKSLPITSLQCESEGELAAVINKVYRPLFNHYQTIKSPLLKACQEIKYYNYYPITNPKPRINILIPSINPEEAYGGIATALKFFNKIIETSKDTFDYRIIVTNSPLSPSAFAFYSTKYSIQDLSFHGQNDSIENIVTMANHTNDGYLILRENDHFIATAWWTAVTAFHILDNHFRFFKKQTKMTYFIQDYESNFNAWSAKWAMSEYTYTKKEQTIAIFNAEELANYFSINYKFDKSYFITYSINDTLKSKQQIKEKKKQILIYGRLFATRNIFEILVTGIYIWQKRNPIESKEWKIISLGESFDVTKYPYINNFTTFGKVSLEEYADFLNESKIGISLMISPHPSYPPLEMAYFGLLTITNSYQCKDLSLRSNNIVNISDYTPESLADQIEKSVERVMDMKYIPEYGNISDINCSTPRLKVDEYCGYLQDILSDDKK